MSLTPEQLLQPRWKCISRYPGNPFKVGQVIIKHKFASGKWYVPDYMYDPDDFPEIFQPLQWWEYRQPDDMPKFLKTNPSFATSGLVFAGHRRLLDP